MATNSLIKKYTGLYKSVYGKDPSPKSIEIFKSYPDNYIKGEIRTLEKELNNYNKGGIVSLNNLTQPIGYR